MAITDYASLQTAVADLLHRASDTALLARIPGWIQLAEARLSAQIKSRSMETRATLTTTAGNGYVSLPADVIESRRLLISSTDPQRGLKYVSPDELTYRFPSATTGEPVVWTVIGAQAQLGPVPDAAYTLELAYLQRIPALSVSNTTNWLLTASPDVYLYGTLLQAVPFTGDDPQPFTELYAQGVAAINAIDWYSGTTMQVRAA